MIEWKRVLEMALALPGTAADQPFEEDFDSTVLRHSDTGKWFGILLKAPRRRVGLDGEGTADILNLKCDPLLSYGLRQTWPDIIPAWHMNKHLWISVRLEGAVPEETLELLMRMSYDLTAKKARRPAARQD